MVWDFLKQLQNPFRPNPNSYAKKYFEKGLFFVKLSQTPSNVQPLQMLVVVFHGWLSSFSLASFLGNKLAFES